MGATISTNDASAISVHESVSRLNSDATSIEIASPSNIIDDKNDSC